LSWLAFLACTTPLLSPRARWLKTLMLAAPPRVLLTALVTLIQVFSGTYAWGKIESSPTESRPLVVFTRLLIRSHRFGSASPRRARYDAPMAVAL
jgi:hypothetical protein